MARKKIAPGGSPGWRKAENEPYCRRPGSPASADVAVDGVEAGVPTNSVLLLGWSSKCLRQQGLDFLSA